MLPLLQQHDQASRCAGRRASDTEGGRECVYLTVPHRRQGVALRYLAWVGEKIIPGHTKYTNMNDEFYSSPDTIIVAE